MTKWKLFKLNFILINAIWLYARQAIILQLCNRKEEKNLKNFSEYFNMDPKEIVAYFAWLEVL